MTSCIADRIIGTWLGLQLFIGPAIFDLGIELSGMCLCSINKIACLNM